MTAAALGRSVDGRSQLIGWATLSMCALGMTAVVRSSTSAYFQRFFVGADPGLVLVVASVAGAAALSWLRAHFGFEIVRGRATLRGMAVASGLASMMAVPIVVADVVLRYPADANVPVPEALLFYPAVGFVAEVVFHILPLAATLAILVALAGRRHTDRIVWLAIGLVAVAEPTFQLLLAGRAELAMVAYTWAHIFAIALLQLAIFRRYDFASMLAFRLVYYALWHISWGVLRLELLF